jgi:MFS family permease
LASRSGPLKRLPRLSPGPDASPHFLLIGWALGGIVFGRIADRIGRTRTLMVTMLLYAFGTALCALAPNIWMLAFFRFIASLGIGGEWAAGAAMVAETVPEKRRLEMGALLYHVRPFGLFLASAVNHQIAGVWMLDAPETSWRWVFACGLLPAAVALLVRMFRARTGKVEGRPQECAAAADVRTLHACQSSVRHFRVSHGGHCAADVVEQQRVHSCVSTGLARAEAAVRGLDPSATRALAETWKAMATEYFNWGGLIGTLLTVPFASILAAA